LQLPRLQPCASRSFNRNFPQPIQHHFLHEVERDTMLSMRGCLLFLALVISTILCGCGGGGSSNAGPVFGRISVIADFQPATRSVPGYADSLRVTVTAPNGITLPGNFPNPFLLNRTTVSRELQNLVPSNQPYQFAMEALTGNTVVGTANRSVVVAAGTIREVDVSSNLNSEVAGVVVEGATALTAGEQTQFTAHAVDVNNATLFSGAGFSWITSSPSVLTVNPDTGSATAGLLGDVTVSATLRGTVYSSSLNVNVASNGGVSVQISPPLANLLPGTQQQFTAQVTGAANTGVAWTVTPLSGSGTVTTTGVYTAPTQEGMYFVQAASLADPSSKAEALVSVAGIDSQYRIAYESFFDGNVGIWMTNLGGTTFTRLTDEIGQEWYPTVSPSGTILAFAKPSANGTNLCTLNLSTGLRTQLTNFTAPTQVAGESWSADGQFIYFAVFDGSDGYINRINVDGSGMVTLINGPSTDFAPYVSPDGTKLLFASARTGPIRWYLANIDGSGITPLPVIPDPNNSSAAWSNDGAEVIVNTDNTTMTIVNASTLSIVDSFPAPFSQSDGFMFTPDDQSIMIGGTNPVGTFGNQLWVFSRATKILHRITDRTGSFVHPTLFKLP
jgi:hypothetical protein